MSPAPRDVTRDTVAGLRWSYLAAAGGAVVQLLYVAALSRLLEPAAFGLMAIATLVVNFAFYFSRMGVAQALIQKPDLRQEDIRVGATVGLVFGGVSFAVLWVLAPVVAEFFDEAAAAPLLRAMAATLLLSGLAMTSQGLLRRGLRFRALAIIDVTGSVAGLLVGVGAALAGAGVWSLVAAALTSSVVHFVWQYAATRHPLRPIWRVREFRALYGYGARVSVLRFTEFLGKNLDTFVVARVASAAVLGQYNRAFHLVNLPLSRYLASALSTVLFPGFARIQQEPRRLHRAYLSVTSLGALVLFPLSAGMAVAANEIVRVVLGDQWDRAALLVPYFALAAALNIMSRFAELLCEARAELNRTIALQFGSLIVLAGLLALAADTDAVWPFALALAVAELVRHAGYLLLVRRQVGLGLRDVFRAYGPAVVAAAVVALLVAGGRQLTLEAPVVVTLATEVGCGALGLAFGIRLNPFRETRREIWSRLAAAGVVGPGKPTISRLVRLLVGVTIDEPVAAKTR